jgi:hypothetical protein
VEGRKSSPIRVRIRAFQSIEELDFEIDGFTCVTGPTNIGKSAIVRSIFGALTNAPATKTVRKGESYCTVELESEAWKLKWEKGDGVSKYWLNGGDKPLANVGQGQIEQVAALGFQSIKIGRDDKTYPWAAQSQYDSVFLMNESGPSVTDFLSEVANLKLLQDAIIVNVKQRRIDLDEAKAREKEVARLITEEARFEGLDNVVGLRRELEAQAESIEEYWNRVVSLDRVSSGIERARRAVGVLTPVAGYRRPRAVKPEVIQKLADLRRANAKLVGMAKVIQSLRPAKDYKPPVLGACPEVEVLPRARALRKRIDAANALVAKLKRVEVPKPPELPKELPSAKRIHGLMVLEKKEVERLEGVLASTRTKLGAVREELSSIPTCPTCKRPVGAPAPHRHA